MSNVLPLSEQRRVWIFYRTRFIFLGSLGLGIVALIVLITLLPSYIMLALNRPITEAVVQGKVQVNGPQDRVEALRAQAFVGQLFPLVAATTSAMDSIRQALDGKPVGVLVNQISYSAGGGGRTITLTGTAQSREGINALRKELEAKGVFTRVSVPVGDLVGASGNQFTVTLNSAL